MNIRKIARDFARRTVAEYELMEEGMPVLISNDGQEPVHTDASPICKDVTCPCRGDMGALKQAVFYPWENGLLTVDELHMIMRGENI